MKAKAIFLKAGLLMVGGTLLLEIALRILGFGAPLLYVKSVAGYEVRPNQHIQFLFHRLNYNQYGIRGREITSLPSSGVRRVMFLGDSITYGGDLVNDSQTYPMVYQDMTVHTEVLNASAGGWSVFNEEKWLDEHGLYGSQLLVLEVGENDLYQSFSPAETAGGSPSFPERNPASAIYNLIKRYLLPRLGLAKPAVDPGAAGSPFDRQVANDVIAAISSVHAYAKNHGADMVILYMDPKSPDMREEEVWARDNLLGWARTEGLPVIRPRLDKAGNPAQLFRDGLHPNAEGNKLIAKVLFDNLH